MKELSREKTVIENDNQNSSFAKKKTTSIFIGISIDNNPFWGIPIFGNSHISWLVLNPHLIRHFVAKNMVIQAADCAKTLSPVLHLHPDPPGRVTGCTAKAAMSSIKDKTLTWSRDVQGVTRCAPVTSSVIKRYK